MTDASIPKTVRGKRPQMFEERGVDYVMAIALALAEEVSSLRDRLDLVERVADSKGLIIADEIESFELSESALTNREERRQAYLDRLFAVYQQEKSEIGVIASDEHYKKILDEIAQD